MYAIAEVYTQSFLLKIYACILIQFVLKFNYYFVLLLKEVTRMKENLHPSFEKTTIKCACGNEIETRSTKENIRVEICSKCHPFFTGKQKLVDTSGRVDMFKKRYGMQDK